MVEISCIYVILIKIHKDNTTFSQIYFFKKRYVFICREFSCIYESEKFTKDNTANFQIQFWLDISCIYGILTKIYKEKNIPP